MQNLKKLKKHEVQVCMLKFWFGEYSGGALRELLKPSDICDYLYKKNYEVFCLLGPELTKSATSG
jgi:hypothetical protein